MNRHRTSALSTSPTIARARSPRSPSRRRSRPGVAWPERKALHGGSRRCASRPQTIVSARRVLPAEQHQADGDPGPDRDHQAALARRRLAPRDRVGEHVEDRGRADVAVRGERVPADLATSSWESSSALCTFSMIRRPPGWTIQWSISERSSSCSRRKLSATAGSPAPARSGSSRARCRWLSVGVMSSLTASSVPASWCTREARITGRVGSAIEVGIAGEQRRRAAVAEDRRADGLRARVLGRGAHQGAAHALRRDDERVLAGVLAQRLGGELHQRHAARAADAGDVVLVGRRGPSRSGRRAGARAWGSRASRGSRSRRCRSRAGSIASASTARIEWRSSSCSIRVGAALQSCRARNSSLRSRWRRLTPQRSKMPSANSSPFSPSRSSTCSWE